MDCAVTNDSITLHPSQIIDNRVVISTPTIEKKIGSETIAPITGESATLNMTFQSYSTGTYYCSVTEKPQIQPIDMIDILPRSHFEIRNHKAVKNYLSSNRDLPEILIEGLNAIKPIFGEDTKISISIHEDPEYLGFKQLVAKIVVHEGIESALTKLDAFDEIWLLDQSHLIGTRLSFNLEFV